MKIFDPVKAVTLYNALVLTVVIVLAVYGLVVGLVRGCYERGSYFILLSLFTLQFFIVIRKTSE
jgi:hypothetical protein